MMLWKAKPINELSEDELQDAERFVRENQRFAKVGLPDLRALYLETSFAVSQERVNRTMAALRAE